MNIELSRLPSGSGIDCDWSIKELKNGTSAFSNSWHIMTEYGYYNGFIDFTITFPLNSPDMFKITFQTNSKGYYWIDKLDLRTYLEDLIYSCLFE